MRLLDLLAILLCGFLVSGCGGGGAAPSQSRPTTTRSSQPSATAPTAAPSPTTSSGSSSGAPHPDDPGAPSPSKRLRGVDVSHHQGPIDWGRVRRDGIDFAYLKTSEGRSFTDPRFLAYARAAHAVGMRVGGYHYFSLCSPGAAQGEHFSQVLAAAPARSLPPAIDLELLGNCAEPPPRPALMREIRAFLGVVERRTGQRVVVYAYPDLEARYRLSAELGRPLWVRRIGDAPPSGQWWIWQQDDQARVAGIRGPVDLNLMAR